MTKALRRYLPWGALLLVSFLLTAIIPISGGLWSKVLTISGVVNTGELPGPPPTRCEYGEPTIKSIWPALVELDPLTLQVKSAHAYWEITKSNADPLGDYAWGLSGEGTAANPLIHFLHTICNFNNGVCGGGAYPFASIFRIDLGTGVSTRIVGTGTSAFGLAQNQGQFYFAYSYTVRRLGGGSINLPQRIGGLEYVPSPSGAYLLAISRELGSHAIYRVALGLNGDPVGWMHVLSVQVPPGSPLEPYTYTSLTYGVIAWGGNPAKEVLYVSKDDGTWEPSDVVGIVDFATGQVLRVTTAIESGIFLPEPITWPNGMVSAYVNWANPQGLEHVGGRLFLVSRFYWNKGPLCEPKIDVEKSGPSTASVGETITYTFSVRNTGDVPLTDVTVTDDLLGDLTAKFVQAHAGSDNLDIGEVVQFSVPYVIPQGTLSPLKNTVTAKGWFQSIMVQDSDKHAVVLVPVVDIDKTGPPSAAPGETVQYTIKVTNTGKLDLESGQVSDSTIGLRLVAAQVLFADHFNAGVPDSAWKAVGATAPWAVQSVGAGNSAWLHTTASPVTFPEGQYVASSGSSSWANYSLSLDVRLDKGNNYPGGVRARVDATTGAGYSLWLYPVEGKIRLWKSLNWEIKATERVLLAEVSREIAQGWNHVRIDFSGQQIHVIWNGTEIISVVDAAYPQGTVALEPGRAGNMPGVVVAFDNVLVQSLPAILKPADSVTFTVNHTMPLGVCEPLKNTALVTARAGSVEVQDSDDHQIQVVCEPRIVLKKYVSVDGKVAWNDAETPLGPGVDVCNNVYFKFVVGNSGTVTLTNITLTDSMFDLSACPIKEPLPVGESFECVIGPFGARIGQHVDEAMATGNYGGRLVQDYDKAHYYGRMPGGYDPPISASADDTYVDRKYSMWQDHRTEAYALIMPENWGGLRFLELGIPQGARVLSARLEVNVLGDYDDPSLYLYAEAADNPADFTGALAPTRPRTSAYVRWTGTNMGSGWRSSPDLTLIIQEVVNRPGWSPGNALVLLLRGVGTGRLVFAQWDLDQGVSAARLHVTYESIPSPSNVAPSVDAGADQEVTLLADGSAAVVPVQGGVSDDGLPNPPGVVSVSWSQVEGPAGMSIENPAAVQTTASFTQPGVYVLTLVADDGQLQAHDEVMVTVTSAVSRPLAQDDTYEAEQGIALMVGPDQGVLANDVDPEGDTLTALLERGPLHGVLTLNADGSFQFGAESNYVGSDSFTYRASDGTSSSEPATVSVTIRPVNRPPIALDDEATTEMATPVAIHVLSNDADPDGDTLTVASANAATQGEVTNNGDGTVTYTPQPGFSGEDSFQYVVNDGRGGTASAIVRILVVVPQACEPEIKVTYLGNGNNGFKVDFQGREYYTARLGGRRNESTSPVAIGTPTFTGAASVYDYPFVFVDGPENIDKGGMLLPSAMTASWRLPVSGDGECQRLATYVSLLNGESRSKTVAYRLAADGASGEINATLCGGCREVFQVSLSFAGDVTLSMEPKVDASNTYFLLGAAVVENP